jgi:hypothetical protein
MVKYIVRAKPVLPGTTRAKEAAKARAQAKVAIRTAAVAGSIATLRKAQSVAADIDAEGVEAAALQEAIDALQAKVPEALRVLQAAEEADDNEKGDYILLTQGESCNIDKFIEILIQLKGSGTAGEVRLWIDLIRRGIVFVLSQGMNLNLEGFLHAKMTIRGTIKKATGFYNRRRNSLYPTITFSRSIIKALADTSTTRVSDASSGIYVEHVQNTATGNFDKDISVNSGLKITGTKIKVDGTDPSVGIYFVDADDDKTKVSAGAFINNGDKEVDIIVPNLAPGVYLLEITTMSSGGTLLTTPRSYLYDVPLTVVAPTASGAAATEPVTPADTSTDELVKSAEAPAAL